MSKRIMAKSELEPTGPHLMYLVVTSFLMVYALFSLLIRNRLHLSEPPLATAFGILIGPKGLGIAKPFFIDTFTDDVMQEITRLIVGIQCFAVGLELPEGYFKKKWKVLLVLLGPVMITGWLLCAVFIMLIFDTPIATALTISACLTPTDPVLAASILSNSQFSTRVPKRIRDILSAESGINDGVSFPFLFFGLSLLTRSTAGGVVMKWFLITVLYQCVLGVILGLFLGYWFNKLYRISHKHEMMGRASYLSFYLLLAVFSIGLASTLGVDDFLVAFCAGCSFSHNGNTYAIQTQLPAVIDLVINSAFFVFYGAIIPWGSFDKIDSITPWRLLGFLVLVLVFRRIPVIFSLYKLNFLPHVRTSTEALFIGHFGPMGVGALFLALEARAQLETDTSIPLPHPPQDLPPHKQRTVLMIWPIVCFVVLASSLVHGLSSLVISVGVHFSRREGERAPLIGAERDGLQHMIFDEDEQDENEDENPIT